MTDATDSNRFPVIGLGASAGGLEAFQAFVRAVPSQIDMAFVLVQHLDPQHKSMLGELLRPYTKLSVVQIADDMPLAVNTVFLIPPNATLTLKADRFRVEKPAQPRATRAPIDVFFRSLAEAYGPNAAAIILSGTGSDGAQGLKAIKEQGGLTIAQLAETARYDGMPKSAEATGIVDHVLPIEQMPAALIEYFRHVRHLDTKKGEDGIVKEAKQYIEDIIDLLRRSSGHDFRNYKRNTILRRIQRRMQVLHVESVEEYFGRLKLESNEADRLFRDLLIGVTQFFRDPEAFQVLATSTIPALLADRSRDRNIRVWVPACSSGEEAYSIAILFAEAIDKLETSPRIQLFGTDIDQTAIETARAGRYPESIAKDLTTDRLRKHFIADGENYRVKKRLREMCIFSPHDIIRDPPFSRLDLVSCRNLLIYLESELQERLVPLFHYSLSSGGYLFLGPSETLTKHSSLFTALDQKVRLFKRREITTRPSVDFPITEAVDRQRHLPHLDDTQVVTADPGYMRSAERRVLREFAPAFVVVDCNLEVLSLSDNTGRYLQHSYGILSSNIVDMTRRSIRFDVKAALRESMRQHRRVTRRNLVVEVEGDMQPVEVIVDPLSKTGGDSGIYLVVFHDIGSQKLISASDTLEIDDSEDMVSAAHVRQLEDDLRSTRERLHATIEELETANEELKSSNEELLSMNEELQSTNEELETSKEELQSVNEELETVNTELRTKNENLNRSNSDFRNLLDSTAIATVFLDKDLIIKNLTPAAEAVFSVNVQDIGRPISHFASRLAYDDLYRDVQDVVRTLVPIDREVATRDKRGIFILRIMPYRSVDDVIEGAVVTATDISRLKEVERAIKRERQLLAAVLHQAVDGIVVTNAQGHPTLVNAAARQIAYGSSDRGADETAAIDWGEAFDAQGRRIPPWDWYSVRGLRGETRVQDEVLMRRTDGSEYHMTISVAPVRDEDGSIVASVAVFNDVSQRKNFEAQLLDLKITAERASQVKSELLAILSHELRTPLNAILGFSEMMIMSTFGSIGDTRYEQYVHDIHDSGKYLLNLINDVLDFSRIESGSVRLDPSEFELEPLLTQTMRMISGRAEASRISLDCVVASTGLAVFADELALKQVVFNLLTNAIKFGKNEGAVWVRAYKDHRRGMIVIEVEDNGIGIAADDLDRIFEPFMQLSGAADVARQGLGLGLALVRMLVTRQGGSLDVASTVGRGSTFTVRLPASKPATPIDHDRD